VVISYREVPGLSPLFVDYVENPSAVEEFYAGHFRSIEALGKVREDLLRRPRPPRELVQVLREQNRDYGCGEATLRNLQLLEEGAAAVVTGQQVGLFSGPLFTVYKALTALRLAEALNHRLKDRFVPVFWMTSDDHDFQEVNHIRVVDPSQQLVRIEYESPEGADRRPMARVRFHERVEEVHQKLSAETPDTEFKAEVLGALRRCYHPGASFSEAFGRWLMHLVGRYGIILVEPTDPRIKALCTAVFRREIEGLSPSTRAVIEQNRALQRKGYARQIEVQENRLNCFLVNGGRVAIEVIDGQFKVKGSEEGVSKEELLGRLAKRPDSFSPNVVLRPIVQDHLLPTIAYVAGPAEVSYFAQLKRVYEAFEVPMPIIYPRASITIVEKNIGKVMEHYGLRLQEFWKSPEAVVNRVVKEQLPEAVEATIRRAAACMEKDWDTLKREVVSFEPTLEATLEKAKARLRHEMDTMEKKIVQAYKRRNDILRQQVMKASLHLFPEGHLQERALSPMPYLIKYGWGFIDTLYEAIDVQPTGHQVLYL